MSNTFQRTIGLLTLFDDENRLLTVEMMGKRTGLPVASLYRYIQNLQAAGFLVQVRPGVMALGPKIAELDRLMRISDPLLVRTETLFPEVVNGIRPSALLLVRYAGANSILAIRTTISQGDPAPQGFLRERGVPYSPLKGASSLAILAHKTPRVIRDAYESDPDYVARAGMGADLEAFSTFLSGIRKAGYALTQDTFSTGRTSIALPIIEDAGGVEASIARVLDKEHFARIGAETILKDLETIRSRLLAADEEPSCESRKSP